MDEPTAVALRNLPLVGRITGNCIFLNFYLHEGRSRFGHSIWNKSTLAQFAPDSWLQRHVQISQTDCKGPYEITRMMHMATVAFAHSVTALVERNFGELIVGLQTMYTAQIINGGEHLPIRPHVLARVYSTPPYIIEVIR